MKDLRYTTGLPWARRYYSEFCFLFGAQSVAVVRLPNRITGANAGGLRQMPIRTRRAARIAQFRRSATKGERAGV